MIINSKILVTGGAGFIGSNLCDALIKEGNFVRCLDNFSTGNFDNVKHLMTSPLFELQVGDIRNLDDCNKACKAMEYVLHEAALGSVPRSINDPRTSNDVNITGFLNMLIASRDNNIRRFVYAASSSTYGDSKELPKVEENIGKPLSPYAVTKYVNELYADVFYKIYELESIGLRYFNVFGRRQDTNGAYAAVIPKFVSKFMKYESPVINGDGSYSRDFTYIDNVVQMNMRAISTVNESALNQVYNTAVNDRVTIQEMAIQIKDFLIPYDNEIKNVDIKYGTIREGDVPHSLASIDKAKINLGYKPSHTFKEGLKEAIDWYWKNLK